MRLAKLSRYALAPALLLAAASVMAQQPVYFTLDNWLGPASNGGGIGPMVCETFNLNNLYPGDKVFATYNLSTAGSLTNANRTLSLQFAGSTLFQCNTKSTCPGNNDNIVIRTTLIRTTPPVVRGPAAPTKGTTATATVEYIDRQNGGSAAVTTVYNTLISSSQLSSSSQTLELDGGSTGTSSAPGDVTAQWATFYTDTTNSFPTTLGCQSPPN